MTDAELIARCRQGHAESFNALVWRWQDRLYNFVLRYAGDGEEAHDLCQQTFLRAYGRLAELRDPLRFSSWLYQIAINACRDHQRRQQRHPFQSLDQYEQERDHPHPALCVPADGQVRLEHQALRQLLARALQTLPEEQRLVVVLKEYENMKFTEIAQLVEAPLNTVKSRLYYGLKALRKVFDEWNIDRETIS